MFHLAVYECRSGEVVGEDCFQQLSDLPWEGFRYISLYNCHLFILILTWTCPVLTSFALVQFCQGGYSPPCPPIPYVYETKHNKVIALALTSLIIGSVVIVFSS